MATQQLQLASEPESDGGGGWHRVKEPKQWAEFPNWPGQCNFALATPHVRLWPRRVERRVHPPAGHDLLHYTAAAHSRRYYFTRFIWRDGAAERSISREQLVDAWHSLLEAHDALYNAKSDIEIAVF
jgi:hypothetical protein